MEEEYKIPMGARLQRQSNVQICGCYTRKP